MTRRQENLQRLVLGLLSLTVFLVLWEASVRLLKIPSILLPAPSAVLK